MFIKPFAINCTSNFDENENFVQYFLLPNFRGTGGDKNYNKICNGLKNAS